ncbi:hypothetical protein THAOC_31101 [Thalassiosira oceanica]|uniref:Uncharacterized protein n=1 Tax=Thalassiosira oceanica TaxID=159749 RepID=K0RLZ3_THAOC|nr:hypothetical protein THAOC_31101 [Thalassiosira oceanica]|eukprot:EJK49971.1 hypothetical protein THAOC_31101 [Thalassiosira oceanica]
MDPVPEPVADFTALEERAFSCAYTALMNKLPSYNAHAAMPSEWCEWEGGWAGVEMHKRERPNVNRMYVRTTAPPAPYGIVPLVSVRWKPLEAETTPTPHEYFRRQLWLCFTKDSLAAGRSHAAAAFTSTLTFP